MKRFTNAIRGSLDSRNWYAALYLALTIPDICSRLEAENDKSDGAKYAAWFDHYMLHKYQAAVGQNGAIHTFLTGRECYALRCASVHEGTADVTGQRWQQERERFHFTVVGSHCNQVEAVLQLDVPSFCGDICDAVEKWLVDFAISHPDKQLRLAKLLTIHVGPHAMGHGVAFG